MRAICKLHNREYYRITGCPQCKKAGIIETNGVWAREVHHDGQQNIFSVTRNGWPRFQSASAYDAHSFYCIHREE